MANDNNGDRLTAFSVPATTKGFKLLGGWACALGTITAFGIKETGSYKAGLSRHFIAKGHKFIEVTKPNRQLRYQYGKSDSLDAEGAARSVLAGQAIAQPKTQTGSVEMIRHLKIARDTAVKCRSQVIVTLKTLIINAPAVLRDTLDQISGKIALIRYIAAFRPGAMTLTMASAKTALRALAQRWLTLHEEIQSHDKALEQLVVVHATTLLASRGTATITAADMLILVGNDPTRIRCEAALAKLCMVCPIAASSGKTNRFRLNRGGNRQANAALYRVAIVRMRNHPPTLAYVSKRKMEEKSNREIIRCLKRYIVREIFTHLFRPKTSQTCA